ncbi:hypothetical protein CHS0354_010524 [Potamilus streckersoni]|uniref:Uncharacterized protein n=1 Tax=Potamilus streckersoni TaxID=2493646 RepID=A0AAE0S5U5_9BIVA|nr:hypothetical protein CHS0354_010524 [Potamilus streckersoni]
MLRLQAAGIRFGRGEEEKGTKTVWLSYQCDDLTESSSRMSYLDYISFKESIEFGKSERLLKGISQGPFSNSTHMLENINQNEACPPATGLIDGNEPPRLPATILIYECVPLTIFEEGIFGEVLDDNRGGGYG